MDLTDIFIHKSYRVESSINKQFLANTPTPYTNNNPNVTDIQQITLIVDNKGNITYPDPLHDIRNRYKYANHPYQLNQQLFYSVCDVIEVQKNILKEYYNNYIIRGIIHGHIDLGKILIDKLYNVTILEYGQPKILDKKNLRNDLINIIHIFQNLFNTDEVYFQKKIEDDEEELEDENEDENEYCQSQFEKEEDIEKYVDEYVENFFNKSTKDILDIYNFDKAIFEYKGGDYDSLNVLLSKYVREYGYKELKHLKLSNLNFLNDVQIMKELMNIVVQFTDLQELYFMNGNLSDESLSLIISYLPKFKNIYRFEFDSKETLNYSLYSFVDGFNELKRLKCINLKSIYYYIYIYCYRYRK